MNRIIFALVLIVIGSTACLKKAKNTRSLSCSYSYQNITYTANKCFAYTDSFAKNVFYMADSSTVESICVYVPFLTVQSFNMANPADSAGISMNHKKNGTTFIGFPASSGTVNITSLSMNLATVNFMAIVDGDTCTGSFTDVPY